MVFSFIIYILYYQGKLNLLIYELYKSYSSLIRSLGISSFISIILSFSWSIDKTPGITVDTELLDKQNLNATFFRL